MSSVLKTTIENDNAFKKLTTGNNVFIVSVIV